MHGLPGNEQNLDLAQAMRRAGFTVISFHYRGSWGSSGVFALSNAAEDTETLLAELHRPERAAAWGVDPHRLILVGHSYGGWAAARALADTPDVLGAVLIAPWDPSYDARAWKSLSPEALARLSLTTWDDCIGRLTGATTTSLTEMVMREGPGDDLTALAPRLAGRPLLIVTAVHDDPDDQAAGLIAALKASRAPHVRTRLMNTDHGFNDHRIALEVDVLRWLERLSR